MAGEDFEVVNKADEKTDENSENVLCSKEARLWAWCSAWLLE